jgi:hypothetical protein
MILYDRFHPLWLRCRFLLDVEALPRERLRAAAEELLEFVGALGMGEFYAKRLRDLVGEPAHGRILSLDAPQERFEQWEREDTAEYRTLLNANREQALSLIVEMLRYQDWPANRPGAS